MADNKTHINSSKTPLWNMRVLKDCILNAVCHDPYSTYYGCCDRLHWGWKIKDFADISLQYAIYPYALLSTPHDRRDDQCLHAMVSFVVAHFDRHPTADQVLPHERSAGPTLYLLNGLLSSLTRIKQAIENSEIERLIQALRNGLDYCLKAPENYGFIANHVALYAHTYLLASLELGHKRYHQAFESEIQRLCRNYQEGWFREYETADPGYQTQCLHYMTRCYEANGNTELKRLILESIKEFIIHFTFPDGSYGGLFSGRATELLYPYPFFFWARESELSRQLVTFLFYECRGKGLIGWQELDFPNKIRLGANYILCKPLREQIGRSRQPVLLPWQKPGWKNWPAAGLIAGGDGRQYLVANIYRGGIFKAVRTDPITTVENGGLILIQGRQRFSSGCFEADTRWRFDGKTLHVWKTMARLSDNPITWQRYYLLRLLFWGLRSFPFLIDQVKKSLVRKLILGRHNCSIKLYRRLEILSRALRIVDTIHDTHSRPRPFEVIFVFERHIPFHMASAGYAAPHAHLTPRIAVQRMNGSGHQTFETYVPLDRQGTISARKIDGH